MAPVGQQPRRNLIALHGSPVKIDPLGRLAVTSAKTLTGADQPFRWRRDGAFAKFGEVERSSRRWDGRQ